MTSSSTPPRRRDAARTRQLLLDAARRRFATIGYAETTVRHIADEAGVNVALISRYFVSKEGLFEAALTASFTELRAAAGDVDPARIPETIAEQIIGQSSNTGPSHALLLILRSSGEERADRIRLRFLHMFAEKLSEAASLQGGDPDTLRAQILLSTAIGATLLRATNLEPLASASAADLTGPLRDVLQALIKVT
ncbi:HTH-type transcriptional regulator betI [Actinoplanes sp. SE50]|uniref:TetR/AcrR family transcriptional regulator n=1 Tax=unclassified Actinoplanes TaxID=2626549 RepID=UPI00023EC9F2|nr:MULTISPECIES: TetR/AcrR family transcriptional regulator [unclassified Actinoplanes]AEV86510.1 HTH-type transcriptional regulator betI [Actinoplanes sp. SE50/110]ATO84908.1 HTH-type transcriptional regulator betI [Actinoplanes sp. SE50]SLM02317.1 TetR family transcriptional regulator [Actinoplanes sp. SE50/110]